MAATSTSWIYERFGTRYAIHDHDRDCVGRRLRGWRRADLQSDHPSLGYLYADGQTGSNIATHISGNPFGVAPEPLANIVGAGLQSAFANTTVTFVTRPTENVRRNMTMVVAFDAPIGTKSASLCRAPGRTPWAPSSKAVRAMMAFCFGDTPLVSIEGQIPRSGGAGDRDFVMLIRDMALRMFEAGPMNAP